MWGQGTKPNNPRLPPLAARTTLAKVAPELKHTMTDGDLRQAKVAPLAEAAHTTQGLLAFNSVRGLAKRPPMRVSISRQQRAAASARGRTPA